MITRRRITLIGAAATILLATPGAAQQANPTSQGPGRASLIGRVTDAEGKPIEGVAVTIPSLKRGALTNAAGEYRLADLPPHLVEVQFQGFGHEPEDASITLVAGATARADIALQASAIDVAPLVVTARRVEEIAQEVPIPLAVVGGDRADKAGAFNVNRLKELMPSVQFYSSNPRNSTVNIRGLGAPFGLTNDGIEAGVGFYVDGVFFARPAVATLDFIDVEQIEVLRGPQGTLFGKNTTAGTINITTRKPRLQREANLELSYGNLGFLQAKGSITGPLWSPKLAGRLSFSGTRRDGVLFNTRTHDDLNDLSNAGLRGQLLFLPSGALLIRAAADYTRQRPRGYAQVIAGVAPTMRNPDRQYPQIADDLGYAPPSFNAFDRLTDTDTPHRSNQDVGGFSLTADWNVGPGRLTSISAWRYWDWDSSSDRDFIGLPVTRISANPSKQRQSSQEIRYAGHVSPKWNFVVGAFGFRQAINSTGRQEQGDAAARFLLTPNAAAATPGLLDGYGQTSAITSTNVSAALFGQIEWSITERLRLLPGLRYNYDHKEVSYDAQVYGGLQTTTPALIALQRSILAPQTYQADVSDSNVSGQLTAAFQVAASVNAFATYATSFKSVGLNLGGVPTDASGQPALAAATVKPENEHHVEVGLKTQPLPGVTANLTLYNTDIRDYQAQVMNAAMGVLRGYLANAEHVRVRGVDFDGSAEVSSHLSFYLSGAYTDGQYLSFPDAPPPLEQIGGPQFVDISGSNMPGISRQAVSVGAEYVEPVAHGGRIGELSAAFDASYRSSFSSSATPSRYLVVDGYALLNARIGFRWAERWNFTVWSRNLLDKDYFELLSAAPGGSGLYVGLPGEPRTLGVTARWTP